MKEKPSKFDTKKKHKAFLRSTITEALCEIHFSSREKYESKIDLLKCSLKNIYPDIKDSQIKNYSATIGEEGLSVKEEKSQRSIFKHKERNHLLQVFPNLLTINEVGSYPTWDVFRGDIEEGYNAIIKAFNPSNINRIGLRYINLIPRKDREEPLSNWFVPNKFYPSEMLNNAAEFLSRSEFNLGNNKKLIVTLSESLQQPNLGSIVFDIDVLNTVLEKTTCEFVLNILDDLHDKAFEVFQSSLSKKYESFLNGE